MGTRGLCGRLGVRELVARSGSQARSASVLASLALLPVLAGCSSSSFGGPTASQQVAAAPPPANAPAPQPAAASSADAYAGIYPSVSLVDAFKSNSTPAAQQTTYVPHPPSTYTPADQPYVPHPPSSYTPVDQPYAPPGQPAYGAPSGSPQAATAPSASAPANSNPAAAGGVYPQQSLFDIFTNKSQ